MDEAGRGPLAGPVVAGACIIPRDVRIEGIDDSKKLTAARREAVYRLLVEHPRVVCATQVPITPSTPFALKRLRRGNVLERVGTEPYTSTVWLCFICKSCVVERAGFQDAPSSAH